MNVGTPHTSKASTAASCSLADGGERLAGADRVEHRVGVDALRLEHLADVGLLGEPEPVAVPRLEERVVHGHEPVGIELTDRDARLEGEQPGRRARARPRRRFRPRRRGSGRATGGRRSRPSRRRRRSAGEHVVVGDAGERAAVVVGDGELEGHAGLNAAPRPGGFRRRARPTSALHPTGGSSTGHRRVAAAPSAAPTAMPQITSEAWWMRTWIRLTETTTASE